MNTFLKYIGLIIEIVGVAFLLIPKVMSATSNLTLAVGGICIVIGIITHIILNKIIKE